MWIRQHLAEWRNVRGQQLVGCTRMDDPNHRQGRERGWISQAPRFFFFFGSPPKPPQKNTWGGPTSERNTRQVLVATQHSNKCQDPPAGKIRTRFPCADMTRVEIQVEDSAAAGKGENPREKK